MKLADLKKFSARKRAHVSFTLPNGMECVIDPHGIARVPQLNKVPDFNLDQCASAAESFSVRTGGSDRAHSTSRAELEKLISSLGGATPTAADHDE